MKKIIFLFGIFLLTGCSSDYICLNGYDYDDSAKTCTRILEEDATLEYYCENSEDELEEEQCKKTTLSSPTIKKVCNQGFTLEGTICIKDGTVMNYIKCGTDRTYSSKTGECYDKIKAISIYQCSKGELVDTSCVETSYTDALSKYVCEDTYELNDSNKCVKTITMDAVKVKND